VHLYENRPKPRWKRLAAALALFAAVVALFIALLSGTGKQADAEQALMLENAIRSAAVSCYATDGRYPATLAELTANYGIVVDTNHFSVRYDVFAANIMPEISVNFKGERAK